jgi:hypothetical protein
VVRDPGSGDEDVDAVGDASGFGRAFDFDGDALEDLPTDGHSVDAEQSAATCRANATAATPQPMLHHLER